MSGDQVLDQLVKLFIIIVTVLLSIRLNTIVYIINNLYIKLLLRTDILTKKKVNIICEV